jgi:uncharacterized protein YeaO (DUF488 family)
MIRIKRVFDAATPEDGRRFLVDRLWSTSIQAAAMMDMSAMAVPIR